jgi:hypothetical protein
MGNPAGVRRDFDALERRRINPVVRFFLNVAPSPLSGLVAVKVIGLGLGVYCWQRGRRRLLGRVNFFYAALVAWNLVALLAASGGNGA